MFLKNGTWLDLPGMYLAAEADGGGGAGDAEGGEPTGDGTGASEPNAGQSVQFDEAQQAAVDRIVSDRLRRAEAKWKADAEAAKKKADEEAEKRRLKEQQEWQKLAEQHESRVAELEPLETQVKAYGEAVEALLKAKLKELGEAAKAAVEALPGKPGPLEQLNWLTANEALFGKGAGDGVGTPGRDKRRAGGRTETETRDEPRGRLVRW